MAVSHAKQAQTDSVFSKYLTSSDSSNKTTANQSKAFNKTVTVVAACLVAAFMSSIAGVIVGNQLPLETREAGPIPTLLHATWKVLPVYAAITGVLGTLYLGMSTLMNRLDSYVGFRR